MRTIWIASYPKSGNTWFRLLIANLRREQPVDINHLPVIGMASGRALFDNIMLFPSALLTHDECDQLRPRVYQALALGDDDADAYEEGRGSGIDNVRFVKTHDAWSYTDSGEPLLGGLQAAAGAIVIVRDPRDVVPSLAHHSGRTIDDTVAFMGNPHAAYSRRSDRQETQLRQQLRGWSGFYLSWLAQSDIPVHLIRYEDLQTDTARVFLEALAFAGLEANLDEAERAVRFADFGEVKQQEAESGFREAPRRKGKSFFRRGRSGNWHDELDAGQVARIESDHADEMARLGYPLSTTKIMGSTC